MELEPPNWLDENFLATVLQGGEEQEPRVTVVKFSVKPAVAAGNNYTSHLYRVPVEYKTEHSDISESVSLIIKIPIQKGVFNDFSEKMDFFSKEPNMYNCVLPKIKEKYKFEFGPTPFYSPIKNGMILKDMKQEGYVLCDKFKQLDFLHCKILLEKLGKFHATSVAFHHDDPELIETIGKEPVYCEGGPMEEMMKSWIESTVKMFTTALKENGGQQIDIDLISEKAENLWQILLETFNSKSHSLNVLNHGDCWSSNMLFKYSNSGEVIDVMLIDFQLLRYFSPAPDIIYFIWTSANEEVRENRLKDLYNIYLQALNRTLEELGCEERLTYEELLKELKSISDFILVIMACVLPFTMTETEDALNLENISSEDFKSCETDKRFLKIYEGKHYRNLLPNLMRQYRSFIST